MKSNHYEQNNWQIILKELVTTQWNELKVKLWKKIPTKQNVDQDYISPTSNFLEVP